MKGTYTLLLVCNVPFRTRIGRLGYASIENGYYLYTGSALGRGAISLEGRLRRHWQISKKIRWHVDYLTSHRNCAVTAAVCLKSGKHMECLISREIVGRLKVRPVLPHAGSSDCACEAHLMKVESPITEREVLNALSKVYGMFGEPFRIRQDVASRSLALVPIYSRKHRERF